MKPEVKAKLKKDFRASLRTWTEFCGGGAFWMAITVMSVLCLAMGWVLEAVLMAGLSITILAYEMELRDLEGGIYRPECQECDHRPVCKEELKKDKSGSCPFHQPEDPVKVWKKATELNQREKEASL